MECGFYVYRFLDDAGMVLCVGRTTDLYSRMHIHFGSSGHLPKACYKNTAQVEYIRLVTKNDMKIKELYYIGKWLPPFNKADVSEVTISMDESKDIWKVYNGDRREVEVHINQKYRYTNFQELDYVKLRDLYITQRKTARQIATLFKCPIKTVQNRIQAFGLIKQKIPTEALILDFLYNADVGSKFKGVDIYRALNIHRNTYSEIVNKNGFEHSLAQVGVRRIGFRLVKLSNTPIDIECEIIAS